MDWLELLRYTNLIAIGLSVGFVSAVAWRSHLVFKIPTWVHGLGISYALFAIGSMVEIEVALQNDAPATWRTAVVTAGAIIGVTTSVLAYFASRRLARAKRINRVH